MIQNIVIASQQGDYPVLFFPSIREAMSEIDYTQGDYFVIADDKICGIYADQLAEIFKFPTYPITASEDSKSLEGIARFVEWLIAKGATKSSTILAIGGGIVQDIATFTAHIYKRGINWEFLPTTLLSQSDSCIGAKCGINVHPYKNQIGVLQSPSRVVIVSEFLESLEKIDLISGYGEIIKLSLTPPNSFYGEFQTSINRNGFEVKSVLPLVFLSLNSKKAIIEIDEYENDLRRILNYGHSFGHALEAVTDNSVSHGYGVLFGIDLINFLSTQWGFLDEEVYREIKAFVKQNFPLDFLPRNVKASELLTALRTDKKVSSGQINFAVLTSDMTMKIFPRKIDLELEALVEQYLKNECIFTPN